VLFRGRCIVLRYQAMTVSGLGGARLSGQEIILVSINKGGIATLSDDSVWRIAPDHLERLKSWRVGIVVEIVANDANMLYSHSLRNPDSDTSISIVPSSKLRQ
jgi:hypothetical protein